MSESLAAMNEIMQLSEVQAAIKARQATKIGNELKAELDEIK